MKVMLFFVALMLASQAHKIDRETLFIQDDDGLNRVYHGVNVIYKIAPFYPPIQDRFDANDSLADEDLENLRKWGMNVIRLHVAWEAFEPTKGNFNYEYLAQIKNIVERCEKYDIEVILDAHQDVLSRFFCGEGFPDWAASKSSFVFPYPLRKDISSDEKGYPKIEDCLQTKFLLYYLSFDAAQTFDDLYHNKNGLGDSFAQFWGEVAKYFADVNNVLGFEIINEPLASSPYRSVYEFLFPNVGNNKNLLPLYQKVNAEIRRYTKTKLLFFEPGTTDLLGQQFNDSPGGIEYRDREVYSYHVYCPLVDDHSVPTNSLACKAIDTLFFQRKEMAASSLGAGKFLTEFGAIVDSPEGNKELNFILSLMESRFTSWAYWEFKYYADITTQAKPGNIESFYDEEGNLYENKVKTLARPYATRICGKPLQQSFDPLGNNHYFVLDWRASANCNGKNTQIFLSQEFYYKNDRFVAQFKYFIRNCNGCSLKKVRESYYEVVLPAGFQENQQVILSIIQN